MFSLQYTWITLSACWQIGSTLCWRDIVDGQWVTSGDGKQKNLRRLNKGSPIMEQFCTHTAVPAYLVNSLFYWQTNHLISVDPCPQTTASLVKQRRLQRANRPIPCPLLIELQSVHGCPGRSRLKQVDGGERTGPYHGKEKHLGSLG